MEKMDTVEKLERVERAIYNITEVILEMQPINESMTEYWEDDLQDLERMKEKFEKMLERENRI